MNQVNLNGRLTANPIPTENGCCAYLEFGSKNYVTRIYSMGEGARKLSRRKMDDELAISGRLSIGPDGTLGVFAQQITLLVAAEQKRPRGVRELHLNKLPLTDWVQAQEFCEEVYQEPGPEQSGD
jgi:hypothetical protein